MLLVCSCEVKGQKGFWNTPIVVLYVDLTLRWMRNCASVFQRNLSFIREAFPVVCRSAFNLSVVICPVIHRQSRLWRFLLFQDEGSHSARPYLEILEGKGPASTAIQIHYIGPLFSAATCFGCLHRPLSPLFVRRGLSSFWYCATNRKVAGSIPAGVIGISHWHKILPIALWPYGWLSL